MYRLYKKSDKHEVLTIKHAFLLQIIAMVNVESYLEDFNGNSVFDLRFYSLWHCFLDTVIFAHWSSLARRACQGSLLCSW